MSFVKPYLALSRYPAGSYLWARDQLKAGNDVRREGWPIEIWPNVNDSGKPISGTYTRIWKIYRINDVDSSYDGCCQGFSSGVVGADNDSWGDLGMDSGGYTPSNDDLVALDWQLVSDVTLEQIIRLDANRMTRHPNAYLARYNAEVRAQDRKTYWIVVSVFVGIIILLAWISAALAHDDGQWRDSDPAVRKWFQELMQPDAPSSSCCGEADAYWCDGYSARGDKAYCTITDDRDDAPRHRPHIVVGTEVEIPSYKLKWDRSNPTGHGIVFLSRNQYVFCYVQGGGV